MRFSVDSDRKIIFGWSPKCGCTHVKRIFNYLNNINKPPHGHNDNNNPLPKTIDDYKVILTIRNPYDRLVSGFRDKGSFLKKQSVENNFYNIVKSIEVTPYEKIDSHFEPQTSDLWRDDIIKSSNLRIFDLYKIDYCLLEDLYSKKIPDVIKNNKSFYKNHTITKCRADFNRHVFNDELDLIEKSEVFPLTKNFYNNELKEIVYRYYKKDFEIFAQAGFNYTL